MTGAVRAKSASLGASMLTTMVLATGAAGAQALVAAADAADGEDSIVVTATRRSTALADVPINISALGAEQLQEQRLNDVRELGAFTPGITVSDTGPRGAGTIVMRGLSADHPHYGWERNAGYGTPEHLVALRRHGATPHHRRSFAPVAQLEMPGILEVLA